MVAVERMASSDKDALRKFYFSQASSFSSFHAVQSRKPATSADEPSAVNATRESDVSLRDVSVAMPSTINTSTPAKVGVRGVRAMNQSKAAATPTADAASAEYFNFLKQQQQMQGHHVKLEQTAAELRDARRERQSNIAKLRRQATELLEEIETSHDWKLRSKYDWNQLARDCHLSLQHIELVADEAPRFDGFLQLSAELNRIRTQYSGTGSYEQHQLFVEQAIRRLSLLEKVLADGNVDSEEVSRIPDTLIAQFDTVCSLKPLTVLVEDFENKVEQLSFKIEDAQKERAVAVDDGEVHVAEQLCYDIVSFHEQVLEEVIGKVSVLENAIAENDVLQAVRGKYFSQTFGEFDRIRARCAKLKTRCEEDIKKMFALREKVEGIESQTAQKVVEERVRSDTVLSENAAKIDRVFAKMEALESELEVLEKERHREVQKRIAEKDRDEHRRAEFAQFCATVDDHVVPLERTIKNMDVISHSVDVVNELVTSGFTSLQEELAERSSLLKDVKLQTHKQHVEVFRGMLLELGEVVYKKERMIEETDKSVQQAHVQQELLAETFNPNAKKFGDVKKRLLATRDDLEIDIKELKDRAAAALDAFTATEDALHSAGVPFVHPVAEQDHHTLALRARMIEFKAVASGHVAGQQIVEEINSLKQGINETRRDIENVNNATTGSIGKTLPMIRAAQKARQS